MTAERMVAADSRRRAAGRTFGGVVWEGAVGSYVGVAVSSRAAPFAAGPATRAGLEAFGGEVEAINRG
jgi:hypothetical protein